MGLIHFVGFDTEVYHYYSDKVLEVVYFYTCFGCFLKHCERNLFLSIPVLSDID